MIRRLPNLEQRRIGTLLRPKESPLLVHFAVHRGAVQTEDDLARAAGGAESGAVDAQISHTTALPATPDDPDLATVVEAWPGLSPAVRQAIMTLIDGKPT